MRKKSENVQRDHYARLFAATRAAEMIATHEARRPGLLSIRIESELYDSMDDIVETASVEGGGTEIRGWQVKRQYTPISLDTITEILQSLEASPAVKTATFAVPVPIEVTDVGELRILMELCHRLGRTGAVIDEILGDLRVQEAKWINTIQNKLGDIDQKSTATRLQRFRVKFIGDDETLREHLRDRLETRFAAPVEPIIAALSEYFATIDGSTDVSYEVLSKEVLGSFPREQSGNFDDVYRVIIEQIDDRLWLKRWNSLSDNLVRNIVPAEFASDVADLSFLMSTQPWPATRPGLEAEMKNVSLRARSYIECFMSNYESSDDSKVLRENLSYKRRWNHASYKQGSRRSAKWDKECMNRLVNLVVGLNNFAQSVRATVNPRYRMTEGGDFVIVDSLGVRSQMIPATHQPKQYIPEEPIAWLNPTT